MGMIDGGVFHSCDKKLTEWPSAATSIPRHNVRETTTCVGDVH